MVLVRTLTEVDGESQPNPPKSFSTKNRNNTRRSHIAAHETEGTYQQSQMEHDSVGKGFVSKAKAEGCLVAAGLATSVN